jgi:cell fate regulator YaaT (PSP1 superfamily)
MSDQNGEREEDLRRLEDDSYDDISSTEGTERVDAEFEAAVGPRDEAYASGDAEEGPGPGPEGGAPAKARPRPDRGRTPENLPQPLYRVKASHSNDTYFAWIEGGEALAPGTIVIAPTRYGKDLCVLQGLVENPGRLGSDELVKIERVATDEDKTKAAANAEKERKAFDLCRQKIETRRLPMKLVTAHYVLDESKILFFFSAESRVDFRELVKDLVSVFKMRIELRQIGVRDEARVIGGCGVCGRVLCCHGVSDKLTPVSIKMAKDQNLSLNSMKISGPCGRLLCCLAYEYGFYRDARREMPGEGVRFQYDGTLFRVVEVNALGGSVKVAGEDGRVLDLPAIRFVHGEGKWRVREAEPAEQSEG